MMNSCFVYELNSIPDCTHHRLVTLCGGNVRESIFRAHEQLLRMIANMDAGQLTLAFRFCFDPHTNKGLQNRLIVQVLIKTGEDVSEDIVKQFIDAGPLCEFYEFISKQEERLGIETEELVAEFHTTSVSPFSWVCEVTRLEDRVEAEVPKELNRYVPSAGFYYSPVPFDARADNDYLLLDTVLSKIDDSCMIEFMIAPEDISRDVQAHDKYLRRLMAVNQYGDDVYTGAEQDTLETTLFPQDTGYHTTTLEQKKKNDPIADEILREQQEYHRKLRQPHLLFHIKAFASKKETALMLASTAAESGFSGGKYRLISYGKDLGDTQQNGFESSMHDSRVLSVSCHAKYPQIWNEDLPKGWQGLNRLSHLATVDELKGIMRLPVGGYGSPRCLRKSTDPKPMSTDNSILIGDDLESELPDARVYPSDLNLLFSEPTSSRLENRLPLKSMTKHLFVSGVPGSGKTTAVFNLLVQLHRAGISFLVIEPAKTEYRILKSIKEHPDEQVRKLAESLRIYTPGNEQISPLRFNPFAYPEGITQDEHISQVLACFEAAMPMGGPLQALIAEAVEDVYQNTTEEDFPQMTDLLQASRRIMEAKQYAGEVQSNLQAAIEVRLGMLTRRAMGRIFQCEKCFPSPEELLEHPTIIEMDYLSQDGACLLTLFILAAIREQIKVDPKRHTSGLHHITVIEEAHNIVGRTGSAKASEDVADPKAFAAQYVSRMLAELRALGEGIVIADQLPSTVAPEVVKNTGTKLAHRLVSNDDREDLGGAMLLGPTEIEDIARLSPGEAYFYTEGLYRPRRVRCLDANTYLQLPENIPTGTSILNFFADNKWFTTNKENIHTEITKAMLHRCMNAIETVSHWCKEQAYSSISTLYDEWIEVCEQKDNTANEPFRIQSEELLQNCQVIQQHIVQHSESFNSIVQELINTNGISKQDGSPFHMASKAMLERWNDVEHPRLTELYQQAEELELRIRNTIAAQT